jgi:inhibitor of cysteine peptidase
MDAMNARIAFPLLVLALAAGSAACAVSSEGTDGANATDDSANELKGIVLTEADNGHTLTATEGQLVTVKLAANPTTGYNWQVASTDRTFGYPTITFAPSSSAVGSGGTTKLVWKTTGGISMVGTHTVHLEYQRPWAETVKPIKTFSFTVKVVAAKPTAVTLFDADNGKTVSAKVGQPIVVALSSNPDTGYDWHVSSTDKTFGYPTQEFTPTSTKLGSPGTTTLTWKTDGPLSMVGHHTVKIIYQHPWAETEPPAKTYSFSVNISE